MTMSDVDKAIARLRALASSDAELATRHLRTDGFVQHDSGIADGAAGFRERAGVRSGSDRIEVVRTLSDAPFVLAHGVRTTSDAAEVFFAVFRFEDGLVAEQWRFAVPQAPPNESGHTQTDGPVAPDRSADTERCKALVRAYYETVHIGGRHDRIGDYMAGDLQIRHEPGVRDGVAAFKRDLAMLTRSRTIDEIVLMFGEGDLVFIAANGTHEGRPCAYVDLYRVENEKLVEHWGFPQALPPGGEGEGREPLQPPPVNA